MYSHLYHHMDHQSLLHSGPHHGHYVSIIKARGIWYLFDDDNVDVIKESDIVKYYGDSNSGSAYVLYYQAVDLNLEELGVAGVEETPSMGTGDMHASTDSSHLHPTNGVHAPSIIGANRFAHEHDHSQPQYVSSSVLSGIPSSLTKNEVLRSTITPAHAPNSDTGPINDDMEHDHNRRTPVLPPGLLTSEPELMSFEEGVVPSADVDGNTPRPPSPVLGTDLTVLLSPSSLSSNQTKTAQEGSLLTHIPSTATPNLPAVTSTSLPTPIALSPLSSPVPKSGFFSSLRHSQSVRGKIGINSNKEKEHPVPPLPQSPIPMASSAPLPVSAPTTIDSAPSESSSTSSSRPITSRSGSTVTNVHTNTNTTMMDSTAGLGSLSPPLNAHARVQLKSSSGKHKEPERKSSTWFGRRKSLKADLKVPPTPAPGDALVGSSPVSSTIPSTMNSTSSSLMTDQDATDGSGPTSGSPWFRHAGKLGRRASEAGISTSSSDHLNPLPISSPSPLQPLHPVSEHKKSAPALSSSSSLSPTTKRGGKLPLRPSTAGATLGRETRPRSAIQPPLPPLPSSPNLNVSIPSTEGGGSGFNSPIGDHQGQPGEDYGEVDDTDGTSRLEHHDEPSPTTPSSSRRPLSGQPYSLRPSRPHSASSTSGRAAPSIAVSTSNGTYSSIPSTADHHDSTYTPHTTQTNVASSSGHHGTVTPPSTGLMKKASRKLSFSAPKLGFGRTKDKDKDKSKAGHHPREKEIAASVQQQYGPGGSVKMNFL